MKSGQIIGLLITICLGLSTFSLKWIFDANARVDVMQAKVDEHDKQFGLLWKYSKWLEAEDANMRFKMGLPPSTMSWSGQ